ncbi:putative O-methyltransferase 2 [Dichanthelium oligosanthes]|uniref:Putative O-methyltransferase 2 n=1 Tax=Dichanthelium oligosanthes TaxID=888268 RepID=A0A1E5UME5_9POAL|nr:putative O-methyltransferase 2 [Dichanthelium oligosanthes]
MSLSDWFKKDLAAPLPSLFEVLYGVPLLDTIVHEGVAAHDNFGIGTMTRECCDVFEGLQSLTDCCGGHGKTARAIVKAFPQIKCTVFDLQRVIETVPADGIINYVAGDMFDFIPPSQAVMLKLVLHLWSDDDCVKILTQCKNAIPSREESGGS